MENNSFYIKEDSKIVINEQLKNTNFIVAAGLNVEFVLEDFEGQINLNFFIQKNANVTLKSLNLYNEKSVNLKANLCQSSLFFIYFADLSKNNLTFNSNVILLGDDSKSSFKFSSLVNENYCKNYNVSFSQLGLRTESLFEGFGVSQNEGNLIIKGVSHIEKGSVKSTANQLAKVILFDKTSKASASPILKIDCDDIKANHGCAIGALNDEHLYYLLSRGLSLNEARKLITEGYLLPIARYFDEEKQNLIKENIEGSI